MKELQILCFMRGFKSCSCCCLMSNVMLDTLERSQPHPPRFTPEPFIIVDILLRIIWFFFFRTFNSGLDCLRIVDLSIFKNFLAIIALVPNEARVHFDIDRNGYGEIWQQHIRPFLMCLRGIKLFYARTYSLSNERGGFEHSVFEERRESCSRNERSEAAPVKFVVSKKCPMKWEIKGYISLLSIYKSWRGSNSLQL